MLKHTTLLAALAINCSVVAPALAQNRPNLIFIMTDDQGIDAIQWPPDTRGSDWVRTRTLNALAAQGVSFTACRMNPNSSPTRGSLMTGRSALDTGVIGVLGRYGGTNPCTGPALPEYEAKVTNRLALQTQEKTLGEVLQLLNEDGYYTILVDKWHLGYNEYGESLGLRPEHQGFDEYFDWKEIICDGQFDADYHMREMLGNALSAVANAGEMPYALFYHSITPHRRHKDNLQAGFNWWRIHPDWEDAMIPQTKELNNHSQYPSNRLRAFQNIEAFDTTVRWLLLDLEVIVDDELNGWPYNSESKTIVFFTSDNGTDPDVSAFGSRAKNTLYEGGIRVPLFVMGEGITGTAFENTRNDRPVAHVDIFETICDIVQASEGERGNAGVGAFPRRGVTFADAINWGPPPDEPRQYTLCSLAVADDGNQTWKVALIQGNEWKLICASGGAGFSDMTADEFYDLANDPEEANNLLAGVMSVDEATAYLHLRDRIVDEWPTAVSVAHPAQPTQFFVEHYAWLSPTQIYVLVVFIDNDNGEMTYVYDEFYHHSADPEHNCDLNLAECRSMTQWEVNLRNAMREQMVEAVAGGLAAPDVRLVDIPLQSTLVMKDDMNIVGETHPLTVGHQDVGGNEVEYRARLVFNFTDELELPPGFIPEDLRAAQVIVLFKHDSAPFDPEDPDDDYLANDRDTDVITLHRMLAWTSDLWTEDNYSPTPLGSFEPPPHIIAKPFTSNEESRKIRVLPMPEGAPVSFGHNTALLDAVQGWLNSQSPHYGIMLKAEKLNVGNGNQEINFLRQAVLRLTFDRRE